jgi:outer membrane protein OmpA-like peptidoglycan-associated protein
MSNVDRIALTNLAINARTLPMRSDAIVHGYAHAGEHAPASLASRRAQTVAQFLRQLGVAADVLHVESSVVAPNSKRDPSEQVDVQFSPICPTGGCGFLCNTPTPK